MHTNNKEYLHTHGSLDALSMSFGSFYFGSRRMKRESILTTVSVFKLLVPVLKITVLEIIDYKETAKIVVLVLPHTLYV